MGTIAIGAAIAVLVGIGAGIGIAQSPCAAPIAGAVGIGSISQTVSPLLGLLCAFARGQQ